ncbi:MAG: RagB/SusD family nutrient uptake outer membrane protein [Prevotellaceae bacterium]|jgi:hypothetical protein|nr:RagB/SusD family nutrient uptake outer membrane protein [Prevotellaceae bacterium]
MKKNSKYLVLSVLFAAVLLSCTNFLDNEPTGGTVTQEQYDRNPNSLEAHVNGLYALMNIVSDHDWFGQKSIDIKTDLMCSDMALTRANYGWFYSDEALQNGGSHQTLSYYLWDYYYTIIKNANMILARAKGDEAQNKLYNPATAADTVFSNQLGQAYAMRAWSYYWLALYYGTTDKALSAETDRIMLNPCVPYYDENTPLVAQPLSTVREILHKADSTMGRAIELMSFYENSKDYSRLYKTNINTDVAKVIRAYINLYRAAITEIDSEKTASLQAVLDDCDAIITVGKYPILSYENVLKTGFSSISSDNWMWGQDINMETRGRLASFWGQVDIFSYSYASAGDVKGIDENLFNEIIADTVNHYDIRRKWFNWSKTPPLPKEMQLFEWAPTGKFYDKARELSGDRVWVNDIVFMRSEEVYLLAAEAAARQGDLAKSASYLQTLVAQRDPVLATQLSSMEETVLKKQIYYNWRVEMWGEGKGYTTMLRMNLPDNWIDTSRKRGTNHLMLNKGQVVSAYDFVNYWTVIFLPYSEKKYNPYLSE